MSDMPTQPVPTAAAAPVEPAAAAPAPGDTLANPAQPLAPTKVPEPTKADSFVHKVEAFLGYPKMKYHPVHGGIQLNNPNEEASLLPATDWKDTPELADAARTWTEAHVAGANNTRAKLDALDEAGHPVVRNSVQADESIRAGTPEPL